MSDKESTNQQPQQRRPQQYYNQQNQQRTYSNRQYQQHSYQQDQQQRRYTNNRHNDSANKQIKKKDEDLNLNKEIEISQYSKQISKASTSTVDTFSHTSTNCVCCLHHLTTYVTYSCMHYICLHCAVKLRIICEKIDCPICRQVSENVICSKDALNTNSTGTEADNFVKLLKEIEKVSKPLNGGFYYDLSRIKHEYDELLSHRCKVCKDQHFSSFEELDQHLKRTHQMFYCELCTLNLKLFTFERKFYNRQLLAQHRREGDSDDQSFKGHPNCSYCDERFFDRDELYRHLRKDHFYCHFCDADGHEEYYENCVELRKHFKISHYLCEIDDCGSNNDTREYSVFRTEIDFNAHKKLKHAKTKSEAKNYGKINIEFNISNPIRDRIRDSQRGGGNQENQRRKQNLREMYERYDDSNSTNSNVASTLSIQTQQVITPVLEEPVAIQQSVIVSEPQIEDLAAATTWRDLISVGPVPRMKNNDDFPSLSNDKKVSSLASIGDAIASTNVIGAWAVKKEAKPKKVIKSTQKPRDTVEENNFVNLKEFLQKAEPRNTSRETCEVINKKVDEEEKKKDKKSKNKKNKTENDIKTPNVVAAVNNQATAESSQPAPPPGFQKPVEQPLAAESLAKIILNKNPPPGFTSQPVPQSIISKLQQNYSKPHNYDQRNNELTLQVISLFDGAQFNIFKSLSTDYHTQKLNAKTYIEQCKNLFLNNTDKYKKFINLLQEMIILLPDIDLQNQLYDEYLNLIQQQNEQKLVEVKLAWAEKQKTNVNNHRLINCINCNQLLGSNEVNYHLKIAHSRSISNDSKKNEVERRNDEFPDLPSSSNIIFNNPQESLSLVNKKKSRNKKFLNKI